MTYFDVMLWSPVTGTILLSIVFIVITDKILKKIDQTHRRHVKLKTNLCIIGCILAIFVTRQTLFWDFRAPSKVDITPLEQLAEYPMYSLDVLKERLETLGDVEEVEFFKSPGWEYGYSGDLIWDFRFNMYRLDIDDSIWASGGSMSVEINVHDGPESAVEWIESHENFYSENRKYRSVKISENVDVLLYHSFLRREAEFGYIYGDDRELNTYVRLENMVMCFREHSYAPRGIGVLTSRSIELICQALL